ncbi:hypothetical protein FO519_005847 [Halicephalobus sp. NKZ332]|nr:hypothetical protein FO519_005847 [Halicephalobus sp. NKZ332]
MNQGNWPNVPSAARLPTPGSSQPQQFPNFSIPHPPGQQQQHSQGQYLETQEQAKTRFEIECEFVQSLANPHYLNYLAQRGYFKEATFVRYLKYLCYFKEPNYARTLKYPQALTFLDLLQKAEFREAIASANNAKFIEDQMLLQWHYYLRKRQRLSKYTSSFKDSSPEDEDEDDVEGNGQTSSEPLSNAKSESTEEQMEDEDYPAPTPEENNDEDDVTRDE